MLGANNFTYHKMMDELPKIGKKKRKEKKNQEKVSCQNGLGSVLPGGSQGTNLVN